jgi:hypothetical protein
MSQDLLPYALTCSQSPSPAPVLSEMLEDDLLLPPAVYIGIGKRKHALDYCFDPAIGTVVCSGTSCFRDGMVVRSVSWSVLHRLPYSFEVETKLE